MNHPWDEVITEKDARDYWPLWLEYQRFLRERQKNVKLKQLIIQTDLLHEREHDLSDL